MEEERLPLGRADGLELLELILAFQDRLDRDEALGTDSLEAGDLPSHDVDLLGRLEQVRLRLHEFLVGQPQFEERLVRDDRIVLRGEDLRHRAGHGRDDGEFRATAALDDDGRHADRAPERRQGDDPLAKADAAAGLTAQFQRQFGDVPRVSVVMAVCAIAGVAIVPGSGGSDGGGRLTVGRDAA